MLDIIFLDRAVTGEYAARLLQLFKTGSAEILILRFSGDREFLMRNSGGIV